MKKIMLWAAMLVTGLSSVGRADECSAQNTTHVPQDEVLLKKAMQTLLRAGALRKSEQNTIEVDPDFIDHLRKSGVLKDRQGKEGTVCIGG